MKTIGIGFLLGSGISIAAGMPSTMDITERILSGQGIMRDSTTVYEFGQPMYGQNDEYVPRVLKFLQVLKCEVEKYYISDLEKSTNYEDLYFLASQIHDSESGEYDNPAIQPLIDKITPDIEPLLVGEDSETSMNSVIDIAREATHYIEDIVWQFLGDNPSQCNHLGWLTDACLDDSQININIFTINHDTILEHCLRENNIEFVDGFGISLNGVRYWEPELFETMSLERIKLMKVHGSVDWFRLRSQHDDGIVERIGITLNGDFEHTVDPDGISQRAVESRPIILVGTLNKMLQYTNWIYAELYSQFRKSLRACNALVISGYSFGDKGINSSVWEWINAEAGHKVAIIHPDPASLKEYSRPAISRSWDQWTEQNKIRLISKNIEQTSWEEIKSAIG